MRHGITAVGVGLAAGLLVGCAATMPDNLGPSEGRLAPCPDSPNCVSSFETDDEHGIEPLQFNGSTEAAKTRIKEAVAAMPRTTLITEEERYLHFEFRSMIFRFVDDVEFLFEEDGTVHLRSASRVGYSDLGVNRKRIEEIRTRYNNAEE